MNWSYTKLSKYEKCPAAFNYKYNFKIADPAGPAAQRGTKLHETVEAFTKGEISELPETIHHSALIKQLKTDGGVAEAELYFNDKWELVPKEGYWCVMKLDVLVDFGKQATVWDYKSGRFYESHYDQLMLYSLGALIKFPNAELVQSGAIYIDKPELTPITRTAYPEQLPSLKEHYERRVERMVEDREYRPTPSKDACQWCAYSKKKGGPCQF